MNDSIHNTLPSGDASLLQSIKEKLNTVLDISTGHITKRDRELIEITAGPYWFAIHPEGFGTMFFLPYSPDIDLRREAEIDLKEFGYSEAFCRIFLLAMEAEINYIYFDGAGIVYRELPVFDSE